MDLRTYIYAEIDKAIESYKDSLSDGHYSFDEYKKVSGLISGLKMAKDITEETYRKYLAE